MSSTDAAASAQAPQLATLPVELILQIVEARLAQVDEQLQSDIASLRLTSKPVHKSATTHFYKVIQLRNPARIMDLVGQLQAQPELCKTTRGVWWNGKDDEAACIKSSKRGLVNLFNVDEVAYWYSHCQRAYRYSSHCTLGIHYSLRDFGPWCQLPTLDLNTASVEAVQGTPTLKLLHVPGSKEDLASNFGSALQLQQNTLEVQSSTQDPRANRAVWALHVAASQGLRPEQLQHLWQQYPTITHLTITLYYRDFYRSILALDSRHILDSRMPLLQHLVFRVVCSETEKLANPSINQDRRLCIDRIDLSELPWKPQDAMRSFALQQWRERVFGNGLGPWKDPLTESVRPRTPSPEPAHYIDSDDHYDDYDDYGYNSYESDAGYDPYSTVEEWDRHYDD